jgi:phosphatidylinositol-4-phosphate 3-kinase
LSYRFSSRAIPPLSQIVNVGRSNIRAVAVRRQCELQYFLQRLNTLSDEVAHCDLIYTFFHPIYRDTEPETRKLNGKFDDYFNLTISNSGMPDIRADANSQCQLLLRISLDQPNSELRIFVGHAKNLPLVGREQAPDSYVKTYLRWGVTQHQKHWKRKTQVVRNAQNPTYNTEVEQKCIIFVNLISTDLLFPLKFVHIFCHPNINQQLLSIQSFTFEFGCVRLAFGQCCSQRQLSPL